MRFNNWVQILAYFSILSMFMTVSCEEPTPKDLGNEALIPKPVSIQASGSSFAIKKNTSIYVKGDNEDLMKTANYLAEVLRPATGFPLEIGNSDTWPSSGNIYLSLESTDADLGTEGYQLDITEDLVILKAHAASGIFRGIQTLRQLLPASIEAKATQSGPWEIGTGTIKDYPRFGYRGAMLDVARHFFTVEEVKTFIDYIASYKLNSLHLHLSDDQGWRIEIKKYPKLTEIGGYRKETLKGHYRDVPHQYDGQRYGGFYTQEE
ncbi:MAG: family 20 glycosylhydrolase, partial [Bacteroidota bacterium]